MKFLTKVVFNTKISYIYMLLVLILITFLDNVSSDYENTWNFYYEQPCCGNVNGQHHLRHHRGIILHFIFYFLYFI